MDIIKKLAQELAIKEEQAKAAVQLIDEGNTIPFIARYRKEMTGALNDETLRNLHERLLYLRNLEEKKEQVINAITDQGKMTEDLKKKILSAETLVAVDDLYRPYRPKKQTRATKAKEKGLEPLANILLLQKTTKHGRRSSSLCERRKRCGKRKRSDCRSQGYHCGNDCRYGRLS